MNENEFVKSLAEIDIVLTEDQKEKFSSYASFLLEYNKHTNLTAFKTRDDVYLKHFYDSLLLAKYRKLGSERVLDIGSGAGFPGVPLKICFPDIDLVVLDSNGKKARFLEELKAVLDIDYTVINKRAEEYDSSSRESFDVVTSRAVTQMPILAELSMPFVKIGGEFISYKGNIGDDLEGGEYAIDALGGEISRIERTVIPLENANRSFIFVNKLRKTDEKYPRSFDKINKKPLQKKG